MSFSRRDVLRLGAGAAVTGLAGCAGVLDRPRLSVTVVNWDSSPHRLHLRMVVPSEGEQIWPPAFREDDRPGLDREFELASQDAGGDGSVRELRHVRPDGPYYVRVSLEDDPGVREDFHYYPDCPDDPYLEIRIDSEPEDADPYFRFDQTRC